jgi:acyl-CoA thioesterase
MPHDFDTAIALTALDKGRFTGTTHWAYANMVGPYGGITSATLLQAVMLHPDRLGSPVALTVNFAGPIADGPFEISARASRTNRSTQHWSLELSQRGVIATTATAVFAVRRPSWSSVEAVAHNDLPPPSQVPPSDLSARLPWTRRYEMRFVDGDFPEPLDGIEQPNALARVWLRDSPPRPLDFPSLAGLCDAFFPRVFSRRRLFSPAGTVTLTAYFHADEAMLAAQGDRYVLGVARGLAYHQGFHDQSAEIWGDNGRLLATTHQMVYFRD